MKLSYFKFLFPMAITTIVLSSLALAKMTAQPESSEFIQTVYVNASDDDFKKFVQPFLKNYCVKCHQGDEAEADLDLALFDNQAAVNANLETWEMILEAIDDEFMPPVDEKQPDKNELARLKDWFSTTRQQQGLSPTTIPRMRRLNRIEYENTVGDLLRIEGEVFASASRVLLVDDYFDPTSRVMPRYVLAMSHFSYLQKRPPLLPGIPNVPSDPPVEHGFSNDHTSLSFSPLQAERYFELADAIINSETFPRLSGLWESLFQPREQDHLIDQQKRTAVQRLKTFLQRAFRRPVTETELQRFTALFDQQIESSGSHLQAMKTTVTAILVSPSFLFRQDFSASSFNDVAVDPYAIANRISYFLWASMPDDHLFQAARDGRLGTKDGVTVEVRRMLRDKKIKSLATDFGMQWLKSASVNSARPDRDMFPDFYYSKTHTPGVSMMIEQLLYFETIMVEDRNIMEFIHSDWGYLNRNLMDWYSMNPKKILGYTPDRNSFEDFFRIKWSNLHKGGVISAGATMIGNSTTTRSSPVYRGTWILDVILNRPPPPPPAAVPALEDIVDTPGRPLNVRQRLEQHRLDPTCAVCHDRIDPTGFAFEKFDAVGRFRQNYPNGSKVDARGTLFGEEYEGAARFKAVLLRHEREFVQGFTEHMLKYALGRRLESSDNKDIQAIVDKVIQRGKNFSAVVEEIVLSDLFRSPPVNSIQQASNHLAR